MARKKNPQPREQWDRPQLVLRWVVFENVRGSAAGAFTVFDPSREAILGMHDSRAPLPTIVEAMTQDELCSAMEAMLFNFEGRAKLTQRANRTIERFRDAIGRFNGHANYH
jgi:hypothetical protein